MTTSFMGELIGTMFLILLGDGVVANVLLGKTKGNSAGWIVITTAWALAVCSNGLPWVATTVPTSRVVVPLRRSVRR